MSDNPSVIFTTSGFALPNSDFFTAVEYTPNLMDQLSARSATIYDDKDLIFFSKNGIRRSSHLQALHMEHVKRRDAESYLALVEAALLALDGWTLTEFLNAQINNHFLRDYAFTFCVKLISYLRGGSSQELTSLAGLTVDNLRFNFNEGGVFDKKLRKKQIDQIIEKVSQRNGVLVQQQANGGYRYLDKEQLGDDYRRVCTSLNFRKVIAYLAADPVCFSVFFKFVFTDKYWGV